MIKRYKLQTEINLSVLKSKKYLEVEIKREQVKQFNKMINDKTKTYDDDKLVPFEKVEKIICFLKLDGGVN